MNPSEFNRHQTPPGGWQFREPATGWSPPTPIGSTFDQVVQQIVAMRKRNLPIVTKFHLATDPQAVAEELENFNRKRLGLLGAAPAPFSVSPNRLAASVAAVVGDVKKLAAGFGVLSDWLGEGGQPVNPELANHRASICCTPQPLPDGKMSEGCPFNSKGDYTSWFTIPASELIRKKLERRKDLNLSTPHDAQLGTCDVCLCPLKLKVHTPMSHILDHLKPEVKKDLPDHCWILKGT